MYAETAIALLLPELEQGLFDDLWRIRWGIQLSHLLGGGREKDYLTIELYLIVPIVVPQSFFWSFYCRSSI